MSTGIFAADMAYAETERTGKCTKCGALRDDDWVGCPLDRYCPAPDSGRRHSAALGKKAQPNER